MPTGSATLGTGMESESAALSVETTSPAYLKKPSSERLIATDEMSSARRTPGRPSNFSISRPWL